MLSDGNVSSPIMSLPLSSRKRRCTKKGDTKRLQRKWSERKRLKNTGKSYYNRKGEMISEKKMGEPCQNTCKLKCFQKLDDSTRSEIFNKFWEIGDHSKQYDFIVKHVVRINKKRTMTKGESRRMFTFIYHLPCIQNKQNVNLVVCKQMFLNTLACGTGMITTAMSKSSVSLALVDNRGRHHRHRRLINSEMIKSICDHVNSHYCRKDNKLYLDRSFRVTRMFKSYEEWFDPSKYSTKCVTLRQYRDVVNKKYQIVKSSTT